MHYNCLIVDDEEELAKMTAEYFRMFDISTEYVTGTVSCYDFLKKNTVDLMLLDINLGDGSGFDICKKVREKYQLPILFVSARQSDDDVLVALSTGGDDYIKKPYTLSILLAKVKTILARYEKAKEGATAGNTANLSSGDNGDQAGKSIVDGKVSFSENVSLDTNTHKLMVNGAQQSLKAMEYKLLYYLLENAGRVVTKDELLKNVWEDEYIGEGTLAVHIRHIREKIEKDPKEPEIIKTIWGVGYMIDK